MAMVSLCLWVPFEMLWMIERYLNIVLLIRCVVCGKQWKDKRIWPNELIITDDRA